MYGTISFLVYFWATKVNYFFNQCQRQTTPTLIIPFFAFRNSFHIQFCYFAVCPLSDDGGILILSPRSFRVTSKLSGCPIMSLYHF